jgi:hypothetical protein
MEVNASDKFAEAFLLNLRETQSLGPEGLIELTRITQPIMRAALPLPHKSSSFSIAYSRERKTPSTLKQRLKIREFPTP